MRARSIAVAIGMTATAIGTLLACSSFSGSAGETVDASPVSPVVEAGADSAIDVVGIDEDFDNGGVPWSFTAAQYYPADGGAVLARFDAGAGNTMFSATLPRTALAGVLATSIPVPAAARILHVEVDACAAKTTATSLLFQGATFGTDKEGVVLASVTNNITLQTNDPNDGGAKQTTGKSLPVCPTLMNLAYDYDFTSGTVQLTLDHTTTFDPKPAFVPPRAENAELSLGVTADTKETLEYRFDNFVARWR